MTTEIVIADVTETTLAGTGAFDVIMRSVTTHVSTEYEAGRISSSDYASVYLGAMQTALQQAVTFVLGKDIAEAQADKLEQDVANAIKQEAKIDAEIKLLNQKFETERAQTEDYVLDDMGAKILTDPLLPFDDVTNPYLTITGVIGKQKSLYTAQTDGFARDAEQKLLKIMADSYSVRRSTEAGALPPTALDNSNISTAVTAARSAAGL